MQFNKITITFHCTKQNSNRNIAKNSDFWLSNHVQEKNLFLFSFYSQIDFYPLFSIYIKNYRSAFSAIYNTGFYIHFFLKLRYMKYV